MSALRAMQPEDLDPERGVMRVRRRVSGSKKIVVPGVKRKRSPTAKDEPPLFPEVYEVLVKHMASFNEAQKASSLLFPAEDGKMYSASVFRKPFKDILKHAGIAKRFTPHGCRGTANDFYRMVASDVVTKAITGHLTQRMHEKYSTVRPAEKQLAARRAFGEVVTAKRGVERGVAQEAIDGAPLTH